MAYEGSGAKLPDRIALGVLTRVVTRELVEEVLAETGWNEQRKRLLPARSNFREIWYRARGAVGLPELHFHNLRHTPPKNTPAVTRES